MPSFYELVTSPQQTDVESDEREFHQNIGTAEVTFNEFLRNDSVNRYQTDFELNVNQYNECTQTIQELSLQLRTSEIEDQQRMWTELANDIWSNINTNYIKLLTPIQNVIISLNEALRILVDNILGKWKRKQILFGYCEGGTSKMDDDLKYLKSSLNNIQKLFEILFEWVWKMYRLLSEIHDCHSRNNCIHSLEADVINDITLTLQKLILSSFVIVEQPPQVMHTKVGYEASLRVLLAKYIKNMYKIMVWFLSESQVRQQHQHSRQQQAQKQQLTRLNEKLYEIPYKNFTLSDNLEGKFTDMHLKDIVRSVRYDKVTEKFAMQFRCTLDIENQPFPFDVWTTSLPITVTTNVNQDHIGWATITWDNSFFDIDRNPFEFPEIVPWSHMKWVLTTRFYRQTGGHLSEQHLEYLYAKVFDPYPFDPSGNDRSVSWDQFGRDKWPTFTFFTWFYDATKLTRLYLSKEWQNGLIEGFISKDQAWEKLRYCKPGTFLLRFSDHIRGGISVASVQMNKLGELVPEHMYPYEHSDFEENKKNKENKNNKEQKNNKENKNNNKKSRTIGDLIKNLDEYTHLYPNTPKYEAFGVYYTLPEPLPEPYKEKKRSL